MSAKVRTLLRSQASGSQCWPTAAWLAAGADVFDVAAGRQLLVEGDPSNDVYVLVAGTAAATDFTGRAELIRRGSLIGAIEPLQQLPRAATVECVTQCVVARIDASRFTHAWHLSPRIRAAAQCHAPPVAPWALPVPLPQRLRATCQRSVAALRNQSTTVTTKAWSRSSWASNR